METQGIEKVRAIGRKILKDERLPSLLGRWYDEREYEDPKEYRAVVKKIIQGFGATVVRMSLSKRLKVTADVEGTGLSILYVCGVTRASFKILRKIA